MTSYVALLRAINITGRTIKMDRLRALFAELGLANVATFIASGNVLFDTGDAAEALETRIEAHLQDALGYEVATFLRTPAEITAVAAHRPFAAEELEAAFGLMIAFLKRPPDATVRDKLRRGNAGASAEDAGHGAEHHNSAQAGGVGRQVVGAGLRPAQHKRRGKDANPSGDA